jgi:transcriptional regulator with XRE-family HTH domain
MLSANQARDLGEGLRRLRQRKGLTRYQAAEVCGLPHLVYAWLENGRLPSDDHEQAMTRAWGALQMYHVARGA